MSLRRSRLRFEALARRSLLTGLLLPGLLLLNLLCLCAHDATAAVVDAKSAQASPCHVHLGTTDGGAGADAPRPQHEGAACPHCGDGSALFASPRAVSDLASPAAAAISVAPLVLAIPVVADAIPRFDPLHSPPRPSARNRILRI